MKRYCIWFLLLTAGCHGCNDRYRSLVQTELASGKRVDGLLFDIHFGMTRKEFYDYCWEMHRKDSLDDGGNGSSVLYRMRNQLKYPASMHFFPEFRQDSIYRLSAQVVYDGWAPWNQQLFADSLLTDLVRFYRGLYPGNEFIRVTDPKRGIIYVKVDGNRRIILGKKDDSRVNIDYTNLLIESHNQDR
jgi:hypothetical protein